MSNDLISPAQINFVITLATAKSVAIIGAPDHEQLLHTIARAVNPKAISDNTPYISKREASILINRLKGLTSNPDPSVPETVAKSIKSGTNRYEGPCTGCNNMVAANAGFYYMLANGKYANHHKVGECGAPEQVVPEAHITEGFWKYGDTYVKVYTTQNGFLGGKSLTGYGSWVYTPGVIKVLRCSNPVQVTPKDMLGEVCIRKYGVPLGSDELRIKAAEYGTLNSACMFCARPLNDERSDPALGGAGYGPDCATRYGLPWGNVNITKSRTDSWTA